MSVIGAAATPASHPLSDDELAPDRRLLARGELPVRRPDLPPRQPAAPRAAAARAREAEAARPLGHDPGPQPDLRPHEPGDPELGSRRDLRHRSRARRPGDRRQRLPRGDVQRGLPEHHPRRGRDAQAVPPVLVPGRHPEPRGAGDARARSTRAASWATRSSHAYGAAFDNPDLLVCAVVGDGEAETGPARHELALEQVPRPRRATAPSCRSSTSTATRSPTRRSSPGSRRTSCAR